jgi:hypothetical protein
LRKECDFFIAAGFSNLSLAATETIRSKKDQIGKNSDGLVSFRNKTSILLHGMSMEGASTACFRRRFSPSTR